MQKISRTNFTKREAPSRFILTQTQLTLAGSTSVIETFEKSEICSELTKTPKRLQ